MVKNRKDFKLGIGFIVFSLFCLFYLIPSQVGPLSRPESLMPVVMVIFILLLAVLMLVKSLYSGAEEEKLHEESEGANSNRFALPTVIFIMVMLAWVMGSIGFLLSSSIAMIALFVIFGIRNIKQIIFITVITIVVLYISFDKFFISPLPVGTLVEKVLG